MKKTRQKLDFQPVIGLEVHIELATKTKMFCSCRADYFGHQPNTHCCPVCLGLPGALPVANEQAIRWTVMAGLAFNCQIPLFSKFDRKNYFYPDLPKGYQISQYDKPLCQSGYLGKVRIQRIHLEEDTAKMIHKKTFSLIDFNRSGVPLMEIVTEPDIHTAAEAKDFLKELQLVIRYLGISSCNMEKGSMRLEANISLKENKKATRPNYKVEIKNLNSFKFVQKAIDYEIQRQADLIREGQRPIQETRGWDEKKQRTYSQRTKEEAHDYRYFPDPDLPPIRWSAAEIKEIKRQMPELPNQKKQRFVENLGLSNEQALILLSSFQRLDYFERAVALVGAKKQLVGRIANLIINKKIDLKKVPVKKLIETLARKQKKPIVNYHRLKQVIKKVIDSQTQAVSDYKKGKRQAIEFLVGQVMREIKANPDQVRRLIRQWLT